MSNPGAPPPDAQLFQIMFGFMASRAVSAAAELGVADALKDGPLSAGDLAKAVGADTQALRRAMRALVSLGVFAEPAPGTFALTPQSQLLRSDVPGSMRKLAEMITAESHWLPWGRFSDTLRSGTSGPSLAFGADIFSWFQRPENAQQWALFNAAMTSFSSATGGAIAGSYDFSGFSRIVDIGGGHGALLRAILPKAPKAKGVVFDLPEVVRGNTDTLGGRIESVGGSFFEGVPTGADCYTMRLVIHDWSDDDCRTMLGHVATAMQPKGKVLLFETVMPDTPEPHPAKFMDLNMMAMTEGGRERTEREFASLFESVGLRLARVIPTPSPLSIVEAVRD